MPIKFLEFGNKQNHLYDKYSYTLSYLKIFFIIVKFIAKAITTRHYHLSQKNNKIFKVVIVKIKQIVVKYFPTFKAEKTHTR